MADEPYIEQCAVSFDVLQQILAQPLQNRVLGCGLSVLAEF
jgi:hypothetical protein